jgi:hypothetical protein
VLAIGSLGALPRIHNNLSNVKGLVEFAGGLITSDCNDAGMAAGWAGFGRLTRIPSIWFHGDNDLFSPETWQRSHRRPSGQGFRISVVVK